MDFVSFFHNPDISLPVVRHRIAELMIDLLLDYGRLCTRGPNSLIWKSTFPSRQAYYGATARLRKAGLVAHMSPTENKPVLRLTDEGMASSTDSLRPHRYWDRKWRGIWYVLVYDVPEDERQFRDTLRNFLRKMRMGCLQRSVYITPHDIRPQYDDLMKAARVEVVSFLFESSTVLGRHPDEVIFSAWDFDRINSIHQRYISTYEHNINAMLSTTLTKQTLRDLAHEEMLAYQTAMADDPLLPQQLLPHDYFGFRVFDLHRTFVRHTKHLLRTAKQD